jgi:predicted ester cyclase
MSTEANKALVRRFYECLNQGDLSVIDASVSPHFAILNPAHGSTEKVGAEGVRQFMSTRRAGFPDAQYVIADLIAEDQKVVVAGTFQGIHSGDFRGIAPTGKQVNATFIYIFRIENGKMADVRGEDGDLWDQLR